MLDGRVRGHKDLTFRTLFEARWASFFDALSIKWQYIAERYGDNYLPDFYLPDQKCFVEVGENNSRHMDKYAQIAAVHPVIFARSSPTSVVEVLQMDGKYKSDTEGWVLSHFCWDDHSHYPRTEGRFYLAADMDDDAGDTSEYRAAVQAFMAPEGITCTDN